MKNFLVSVQYATVESLKLRLKALSRSKKLPTKKADLAALLFTLLMDENTFIAHWARLSEIQQFALQEAIHAQHAYIDKFRFLAKYNQPHPDIDKYAGYGRINTDDVLLPFFYPDSTYNKSVFIPEGVRLFLKKHVPLPPEFILESSLELKKTDLLQQETQCYLENELNVLFNAIKEGKLKISSKTGVPSKSLLDSLSLQLNEPYKNLNNPPEESFKTLKSFAWVQFLRSSRWIKEINAELKINIKKLPVSQPYYETVKDLFWDWKEKSKQDEFRRINKIKGQTGKGKRYFTDPGCRRASCVQTLMQCPVGEWLHFDDFIRLMILTNNYTLVTEEPYYLYVGEQASGVIQSDTFLVNAYVKCILMEYFSTLGLIDIAYTDPDDVEKDHENDDQWYEWYESDLNYLSSYDGLKYLRLTDFGAYVLGITKTFTAKIETTQTPINMLSKYHLRFIGIPSTTETVFLSNYANEISEDTWQLSPEKMLSYLENGGELDEIQTFLSIRDTQPFFPLETEHLFNNMIKNINAVISEGDVLLLTCHSEEIAKNIASASGLSLWCQRVGKRQIIIPKAKENQFRKRIHEFHYAFPIVKK